MKFRRQAAQEVSVNLTPLIDVVFLLLIFFMVSTTFTKETQLSIDLPEADTGEPLEQVENLEVLISERGEYVVNGDGLVNNQRETLRRAMVQKSRGDNTVPLIITADALTPHQAVVTAMDIAGQLGFTHLSITTTKEQRGK